MSSCQENHLTLEKFPLVMHPQRLEFEQVFVTRKYCLFITLECQFQGHEQTLCDLMVKVLNLVMLYHTFRHIQIFLQGTLVECLNEAPFQQIPNSHTQKHKQIFLYVFSLLVQNYHSIWYFSFNFKSTKPAKAKAFTKNELQKM